MYFHFHSFVYLLHFEFDVECDIPGRLQSSVQRLRYYNPNNYGLDLVLFTSRSLH